MAELVADATLLPEQLGTGPSFVQLASSVGANREAGPGQLAAQNDLEALQAWLAEYKQSPQTYRSYRREIRRFLVWAYHLRRKPFSGITREDVQAYTAFLTNPPDEWCAPRHVRKTDSDFRLWEGPLSERSIDHAHLVLASAFGYLTEMGYLRGNPLSRSRRTRTRRSDNEAPPTAPLGRYLPKRVLEPILRVLDEACARAETLHERRTFERYLFVLRFLCNTGARRVELAQARVRDIVKISTPEGQLTLWHIRGKGDKWRQVVLNAASLNALERYQQQFPLPAVSREDAPLLKTLAGSNLRSGVLLDDSRVYALVREALDYCRAALQDGLDEYATHIMHKATPHWLRRTYATACLDAGVALKHVQEQLGHGSHATTLHYQTSELQQRENALQGVRL